MEATTHADEGGEGQVGNKTQTCDHWANVNTPLSLIVGDVILSILIIFNVERNVWRAIIIVSLPSLPINSHTLTCDDMEYSEF